MPIIPVWTHVEDGGRYIVVDDGERACLKEQDGAWVRPITYRELDENSTPCGRRYIRSEGNFHERFREEVAQPPGDATSSSGT